MRKNVVYRTTATLSGDIFSPRAALKTYDGAHGTGTINPNDHVAFRSYTNHYLVAENGGGSTLNCNRTAAGAWETFTFVGQ